MLSKMKPSHAIAPETVREVIAPDIRHAHDNWGTQQPRSELPVREGCSQSRCLLSLSACLNQSLKMSGLIIP